MIFFIIHSLTEPKECQEHLRMKFLYHTLKHFVHWIEVRFYDYCHLQYGLKVQIDDNTVSVIEKNCNAIGKN